MIGTANSPDELWSRLESASEFGLPGPKMSAEDFLLKTAGMTFFVYDMTHGYRTDGRRIDRRAWAS